MARGRRGGSPAAARGPPDLRRALLRPRARPPRAAGGRSGGDQSPFVANRRGRRVLPVTGPSSREPTVAAPPWLVHRGERHVLESISLSFLKSQAHGDKLQGDGRVRCEVRCWSSLRSTQNARTHFSATPGSLARRCSGRRLLLAAPCVSGLRSHHPGPRPLAVCVRGPWLRRHADPASAPSAIVFRAPGAGGARRQSRWARPFVLLAREAVVGSSQPASVTQNMVAPLCAFNCYCVHGPRELAVDVENKRAEPCARPNRCPAAPPHSARPLLLREGSF